MTMTLAEPVTVDPLIVVLDQLYDVIDRLGDEQYTRKPIGVITSTIGAHVRHCLDHVRELLRVAHGRELDYDRRERGTEIETRRAAALELISELRQQLPELDASDRPIQVSTLLAADQPPVVVRSSVAREVAFVLSHTIHHHALIGVMVKLLGGWLPDKFGYAPSTVAHLATAAKGRACARSA
jgi:uncharacterized damage-inducible protein DinB